MGEAALCAAYAMAILPTRSLVIKASNIVSRLQATAKALEAAATHALSTGNRGSAERDATISALSEEVDAMDATDVARELLREEATEAVLAMAVALDEALDTYGEDLLIAATGAIAKKGQEPDGEVRVIFDGTNGVHLNLGIKIRDQIKFPGAPDIKAVLAEKYHEGGTFVSI